MTEVKMASKVQCLKDYGKILFGDAFYKGEEDTYFEMKTWSAVHSFINYNEIGPEIIKKLKALYKCSESFQKELVYKKNHLYRGTSLSKKQLDKLDFSIEARGWYGAHSSYKSRRPIQSWSSNQGIALDFALGEDYGGGTLGAKMTTGKYARYYEGYLYDIKRDDQYPMMIEINPSKSDPYLFSEAFSNKVAKRILGEGEYEIIRLANKSVQGIYWIPIKIYNEIYEK